MRGTLLCPEEWILHDRDSIVPWRVDSTREGLYCALEGGLYMRGTLLCPGGWTLHERDSIVPWRVDST